MLKTWGSHSVYGGKIDIKELHREFFKSLTLGTATKLSETKIITQKLSESITSNWEFFLDKKLLALSSIVLKES